MNGLPVQGILLIVFGLSAAAFSGGLMKILAETMPPVLIVWFRFALYFALMLPVVLWRTGVHVLAIPRPRLQLLRGLCMAFSSRQG